MHTFENLNIFILFYFFYFKIILIIFNVKKYAWYFDVKTPPVVNHDLCFMSFHPQDDGV